MSDFFNFGDAPTEQNGDFELMPKDTLAWAILSIRPGDTGAPEKISKTNPNNAYLDLELIIVGGPYDKRKVWDMVGIKGSESWVNQGRASVRAMLESGFNASMDKNPAAYKISGFNDLNGAKVAIKIGVEKGQNGYADKNKVTNYLSPNEQSSTYKDFAALNVGSVGGSQQESAPAQQSAPASDSDTPAWLQQS